MAAVAIMAASGGYFAAMVMNPESGWQGHSPIAEAFPANQVEDLLGKPRPDFKLNDLGGAVVSASDFDGRILLINFWASWCKPCIEEIPMLTRLQTSYSGRGVQIVGIALDDPLRAREFVSKLVINYPVMVGSTDTILTGLRYGNRSGMLPYSVLVGADGMIKWSYLGALDEQELEEQINALL